MITTILTTSITKTTATTTTTTTTPTTTWQIANQGQYMVSGTHALLFLFVSEFLIVSRAATPKERCPVECRGYLSVRCWHGGPGLEALLWRPCSGGPGLEGTNGRTYVRTYRRMDKYPLHSTGHRPFGATAKKDEDCFIIFSLLL